MTPFRAFAFAATVPAGLLAVGAASCDPTPVVCDEFEQVGRMDCVHGSGRIVVEFPTGTVCPTATACTAVWHRQDATNGYWVITPVTP